MSDDDEIRALIATLSKFSPGKPLRHYITHATFPKFKNIEPGTRINFEFPFTAFVGANGIGKSSLLQALWGMPYGFSTHRFWFATDLDPIDGNQKDPQRFFYGYWHDQLKGVVETRKARIGRKRGADYWEPYRLSEPDGMVPMIQGKFRGKSKDRWNPVKRTPIYINSRAAVGSFDRYFYMEDGRPDEVKRRSMRRQARRLKSIIDNDRKSFKFGKHERLFENRMLETAELQQASRILGRQYDSARWVRHSLYPGNRAHDVSVIFKRGSAYSEAYAGSGEIAVVNTVVTILNAPKYSLILLDEPETSLHPGAQRALLRFILEQVKNKHHQVIVSTHSSEFVVGLPYEAIKVVEDNGEGKARVLAKSSAAAALKRLGKTPPNKIRVLVEDDLAQEIVLHAGKGLDIGDAERLEIIVAPGGAEGILKYHGPSAMLSGEGTFVMLDGDKRKVASFTDPATVAPMDHLNLSATLIREVGVEPVLLVPSNPNNAQHETAKAEARLKYLGWLRKHVDYLPRKYPELIVLNALDPGNAHLNGETVEVKAAYFDFLREGSQVDLSGKEMLGISKVKIGKIPSGNADVVAIRERLQTWLSN